MKKSYLFAFAAAAAMTVSCSNDELVNEMGTRKVDQTPIGFNVQKQNITRATNLEDVKHYNFGVWAWKVNGKNELADAEVMNHYLVGWNGKVTVLGETSTEVNKGYNVGSLTTTYAEAPGTVLDHKSPWFYEGLGTDEYKYTGTDGYYKSEDDGLYKYADYKSVNSNQYLRYWDLAYNKTNFYCYSPYNANVSFEKKSDNSIMTFPATAIRDGYDEPLNSTYNAYSRTLGEFMYAGVQATNANLADVTVPFKHMGAQLFIRFYEDIPGYKVEIIDLFEDRATTPSGDIQHGIQATPAIASGEVAYYTKAEAITHNASLSGAFTTEALTEAQATTYNSAFPSGNKKAGDVLTADEIAAYNATLPGAKWEGYVKNAATFSNGTYYTTQGATVSFAEATATPTYKAEWDGSSTATNTTPLMFKIPTRNLSTQDVAPANLTDYTGLNSTTHKIIEEKAATGIDQKYSYSPTIYYPVAQPTESNTTGFTFHVSYRVIAEDNKEVVTVHNATVHVPYKGNMISTDTKWDETDKTVDQFITVWQPNTKYTYTFKITRNTTGTTNPDTDIDPTSPAVDPHVALYPIVFDFATIDDYTTNYSEYIVSDANNTGY